MDAGRDGPYSALEVVPHQYVHQTNQQDESIPTDSGKQVIRHEGKQVIPHEENQVSLENGKQHMVKHWVDHHVQPSKRNRILLGGAVGLIVILALVLGLVFGLRHKRSGTTVATSSSNSSAVSTPNSPPQRNIAALSFASESVNNTRVYFQDNVGQIMEAANSARDTKWSINGTGIVGKNGSAIAAAVSRPGFPLVSHFSPTNDVLQIISLGYQCFLSGYQQLCPRNHSQPLGRQLDTGCSASSRIHRNVKLQLDGHVQSVQSLRQHHHHCLPRREWICPNWESHIRRLDSHPTWSRT